MEVKNLRQYIEEVEKRIETLKFLKNTIENYVYSLEHIPPPESNFSLGVRFGLYVALYLLLKDIIFWEEQKRRTETELKELSREKKKKST
jgi:hypothetical protein